MSLAIKRVRILPTEDFDCCTYRLVPDDDFGKADITLSVNNNESTEGEWNIKEGIYLIENVTT